MKVTIQFDPRDDVASLVEGTMMTEDEELTVKWNDRLLTYHTSRLASEVINAWEEENFCIDDFPLFAFSRDTE